MVKIKKQYIYLTIFIIIIGAIFFVILKNINMIRLKQGLDSGLGIARPSYLTKPVPKINKIKTIVNNPKFKEMKYIKEFFEPIEVESIGKANPFFPFRTDKGLGVEE